MRKPSKPWWHNKEFIDKVYKSSAVGSRDISAVRIKKKGNRDNLNLPPVDTQINEIYAGKGAQKRTNTRRREIKRSKPDEGHIMVEFDTVEAKDGDKVAVSLVPITPVRKYQLN